VEVSCSSQLYPTIPCTIMDHSLETIRQTLANLLAIAISTLFPKVQLVSGEATEIGFFYDFNFNESLTVSQLSLVEERIHDLMRQELPIKEMEMMRKNAMELFKHHKQDLKVALLKTSDEDFVNVCQIGPYYDLSNAPLSDSTKKRGVFKLLSIKTYKRSLPGRQNLTLTRISGTAFHDTADLKEFLKVVEAAKEFDHRTVVKDMGLLTTLEETCPGCWSWLPKGALLRDILLDWAKAESAKQRFQPVVTSNLLRSKYLSFPEIAFSGEDSYPLAADKTLQHAAVFKSKDRLSSELPFGLYEVGQFFDDYRRTDEYGLLKARTYSADAATLFCESDQLDKELISSLQFINKVVNIFGFEAHWILTVKSRNVQSTSRKWKEAENSLVNAMKASGIDYALDNDEKAYYGPSVEVRISDALGRQWAFSYVSIDIYHPEKLGLYYQTQDKEALAPSMVSRSLFGSLERLVALLIENRVILTKGHRQGAEENIEFEKFLERLKVTIEAC
jgi:threonyl-tRNA synthetase